MFAGTSQLRHRTGLWWKGEEGAKGAFLALMYVCLSGDVKPNDGATQFLSSVFDMVLLAHTSALVNIHQLTQQISVLYLSRI